jgi:F0F1-type ATP synthase assembly protein I
MRAHAVVTQLLALVMIGLGVAILARTLTAGGGQVGTLVGLLFIGLGAGRLYLARKAGRGH